MNANGSHDPQDHDAPSSSGKRAATDDWTSTPTADGTGTLPPEPSEDATADELEADITRTRRELGETVGALSEKLDPKVQTKRQVEDIKGQAQQRVGELTEQARVRADALKAEARAKVESLKGEARVRAEQAREKVGSKNSSDADTAAEVHGTAVPAGASGAPGAAGGLDRDASTVGPAGAGEDCRRNAFIAGGAIGGAVLAVTALLVRRASR